MRVVVCVKQARVVPGHVELTADGRAVAEDFVERQVNEPDLFAVEEAIRVRERSGEGHVTAVTVGDEASEAVLRQCLAMGVDRAVRVAVDDAASHDPLLVGRALADVARSEDADLVVAGVQSTDSAQQATGPAVAGFLGVPCVPSVTQVGALPGALRVTREVGGGRAEVVDVDLPVVLTVQTGVNEPRYGTFKDMMKAKKAEIAVVGPPEGGARTAVRRVFRPRADGPSFEPIEGTAAAVAEQLVALVRAEAS